MSRWVEKVLGWVGGNALWSAVTSVGPGKAISVTAFALFGGIVSGLSSEPPWFSVFLASMFGLMGWVGWLLWEETAIRRAERRAINHASLLATAGSAPHVHFEPHQGGCRISIRRMEASSRYVLSLWLELLIDNIAVGKDYVRQVDFEILPATPDLPRPGLTLGAARKALFYRTRETLAANDALLVIDDRGLCIPYGVENAARYYISCSRSIPAVNIPRLSGCYVRVRFSVTRQEDQFIEFEVVEWPTGDGPARQIHRRHACAASPATRASPPNPTIPPSMNNE